MVGVVRPGQVELAEVRARRRAREGERVVTGQRDDALVPARHDDRVLVVVAPGARQDADLAGLRVEIGGIARPGAAARPTDRTRTAPRPGPRAGRSIPR